VPTAEPQPEPFTIGNAVVLTVADSYPYTIGNAVVLALGVAHTDLHGHTGPQPGTDAGTVL
jgi:hypothetical protein